MVVHIINIDTPVYLIENFLAKYRYLQCIKVNDTWTCQNMNEIEYHELIRFQETILKLGKKLHVKRNGL